MPRPRKRPTATGLGQFLSGTWKSEAERAGTWLNATARSNGWIGAGGKITPGAQAALLALRNDTNAPANATADFAQHSLAQLTRAGVSIGQSIDQIAKAAILATIWASVTRSISCAAAPAKAGRGAYWMPRLAAQRPPAESSKLAGQAPPTTVGRRSSCKNACKLVAFIYEP